MKLEQSFTVTAPIEQVWAALVDVERVAPCLPGAEITGQSPDGGYEGTFTVKLGPATAAYRGSLKMESLDEDARTATMSAKGTDKRGQGGATASIVSTMRQEGDETHVDVVTDFTITGRLARFGRGGMIEDISKRLMRDFAQCLQSTLAAEPAAAAAEPALPPESERAQADAAVASAAGAAAEAGAAAQAPPAASEAAPPLDAPTAAEPADEAEPVEAAAPTAPLGADEPEPPVPAEAAAPTAPLGGDEPAAEREAPAPEQAPSPASPGEAAPEEAAPAAAAGAPLPGEDASAAGPPPAGPPPAEPPAAEPAATEPPASEPGEAARAAGDVDPWGPLSPPAEPVAPAEEEPARRTESIPPPSAAARPAPPPAKPVKGFSLLFGVLWDRIKAFFGRLFGRGKK
jgi:carbon monoxide dehydrogenase subunit G